MEVNNTFTTVPGFCSDCGSILPQLREKSNVICYSCKRPYGPEGKCSNFYIKHISSNYSRLQYLETWRLNIQFILIRLMPMLRM